MSELLERLNESQRQIATHTEGNILVLAGAGSGKTHMLTHRIAYLIEQGVKPWQILSVTFTNKAAKEMRERVVNLVSPEGRDVWLGTFHSVCIRMLIRFGHKIGLDSFTIIDTTDQKKIMKQVLELVGADYKPEDVLADISNAKNDLLTPTDRLQQASSSMEESFAHIYEAYEEKKAEFKYIDYDDCIIKAVQLLTNVKEVRELYQNQFRYVLTDETQDTNHSQFQLLRILSRHHGNLFAVGDSDQAIYSFRGAQLSNIINFGKFFPDTTTYRLEQNYRSTPVIVQASNALIENNKERLPKTSFAMQTAGNRIRVQRHDDPSREADHIARGAQAIRNSGYKYSDVAVLYRTNRQSNDIEKALNQFNIPYQIVGGNPFYERKEIKDIVSYLRAVGNQMDELAFTRIINVPKRGVGDTSVGRIKDYADECSIPFSKALDHLDDVPKMTKKAKAGIDEFKKTMETFNAFAQSEDFSVVGLIGLILRETGYKQTLDPENDEDRFENLKELELIAAEWDENSDDDATLLDFLTETSLVNDTDSMADDDMVTLMTIHAAKGLEFPYVFIAGMEEGVFPHSRSVGNPKELEEERRLFYVAMTRAEKQVIITHCQKRYEFSKLSKRKEERKSNPSRFLKELPEQFIRIK